MSDHPTEGLDARGKVMDFITSRNMKTQLKLAVQDEANLSQTILGEAYRRKCLWKSEVQYKSEYIEKVVIESGDIYYQVRNDPGKFHSIDGHLWLSPATFYAPSYLYSITLPYPKPQFLSLEATVIKTEIPYRCFMVAEHIITKTIYFIATNTSFYEGGILYAADVGEGDKEEVVAEKVDLDSDINKVLTALAVDQFTGDIILASRLVITKGESISIESLRKLPHLNQMMESVGVSTTEVTE